MQALVAVLDQLVIEAERVLGTLDPAAPDHEAVLLLLLELRANRGRLASAKETTRAAIDASVDQMASTQLILDRIGGSDPSS